MIRFRSHFCTLMALVAFTIVLSGCAGLQTAIEYKDPQVKTQSSDPIFLDVYDPTTIFVRFDNGSGHPDLSKIAEQVKANIREKGHTIVNSPVKAEIILHAKVLNAKKMSKSAHRLATGPINNHKGALAGGLGGAAIGTATNGGTGAMVGAGAGAVGGGLADTVINSMVKKGTITLVLDMQIAKRNEKGVETVSENNLDQGGGTGQGKIKQVTREVSKWEKYRMQAVTSVTQVNIEWQDCNTLFQDEFVRIMSNVI